MRLMNARKAHVCSGCEADIDIGVNYWAESYRVLCLVCYGLQKQKSKNSSQQHKVPKCFKCSSQSVGYIFDMYTCSEHVGDAYTIGLGADAVDNKKEVIEENVI